MPARAIHRCQCPCWPVIGVDANESALIGDFENAGALWRRRAEEVNGHDSPADAVGRAVPYGVYDVPANRGFVRAGLSANTPALAAAAARAWWVQLGCQRYGGHDRLPTLADAGGGNGYRPRLGKKRLREWRLTCRCKTG